MASHLLGDLKLTAFLHMMVMPIARKLRQEIFVAMPAADLL
jgi:hypothetical protein